MGVGVVSGLRSGGVDTQASGVAPGRRGARREAGGWLVHAHTSQRLVVLAEVAGFQMVLARVPGGWQGSDPEGVWVALWSLDLILQLTGGEGASVPWAPLLLCCHLEGLRSLAGPRLTEVWAAVGCTAGSQAL